MHAHTIQTSNSEVPKCLQMSQIHEKIPRRSRDNKHFCQSVGMNEHSSHSPHPIPPSTDKGLREVLDLHFYSF